MTCLYLGDISMSQICYASHCTDLEHSMWSGCSVWLDKDTGPAETPEAGTGTCPSLQVASREISHIGPFIILQSPVYHYCHLDNYKYTIDYVSCQIIERIMSTSNTV